MILFVDMVGFWWSMAIKDNFCLWELLYFLLYFIRGDPNENHDEGITLPDFAGAIYVDGKTYKIAKKDNTLVNEQVVKDIPINLNDKVTVVEMICR